MLKAKLVIVGGDAKAGEVKLDLPTTIGRGKEADLTIPHALVSRSHSKLFEREGLLWVEDLGSLNGTFVDNHRIESEQLIEPNQLLTLGNITFRAVYQLDESSRKTLPSTSLPSSLETLTIDPIGAQRANSEPTLPAEADDKADVQNDADTSYAEVTAEPGHVFEGAISHRSAISEIDSFDPDEIGPLDSVVEPIDVTPKVSLPEAIPLSKPASPIAPQPAAPAALASKKSPKPRPALSSEPAIDLGIADPALATSVSSIDINLDLADNVAAAPVSFVEKINTGDADSPSLIDDFEIDLGSDSKPEADVDAVRLNSFLKKFPK